MGIEDVQKSAAAAAQAAAHVAERMQKVEQKKMTEQIQKSKTAEQTFSSLMDKSATERGMGVLSQAIATFAKSSIGKMFLKEKDYLQALDRRDLPGTGEERSDRVELSSQNAVAHISEVEKRKQITRDLKDMYNRIDQEAKVLLKEYSQLYARVITTSSEVASAQLDKLERKLKDRGVTNNQLYELKLLVKNSIRGALVDQIKEAFLRKMVSTDLVVEMGTAERGFSDLIQSIVGNEDLGGTDFGGYRTNLQGVVDEVQDGLSRDLRLALQELMNQKMTERLVSEKVTPEEVKEELKNYLQLANRIGFDTKEYLQTWSKSFINEGLFTFNKPEKPSLLAAAAGEQGQQQQQQQNLAETEEKPPEELTEDYLIASLRAAYMRAALGEGWRASLASRFKIRQVKNKMIKLGIYYEELNEKIEKEAQLIASAKIIEMLNETMLERATLYKLSGPAYKMIDAKITGLLRNAKKLEMDFSEYDFNLIRDKANQMVFDVAKRELQLTMVSLSVQDNPAMRDKKNKLILLLNRLKEESKIPDDLGLSEEMLADKIKIST